MSVGHDNPFGEHYKWNLRLTAINVTNNVALYNFLSICSGTHFVTPRNYTAESEFHFYLFALKASGRPLSWPPCFVG